MQTKISLLSTLGKCNYAVLKIELTITKCKSWTKRPMAALCVLSIYCLFVNKYSRKADANAEHKSCRQKLYTFDKLKFNFRFLAYSNYYPFGKKNNWTTRSVPNNRPTSFSIDRFILISSERDCEISKVSVQQLNSFNKINKQEDQICMYRVFSSLNFVFRFLIALER